MEKKIEKKKVVIDKSMPNNLGNNYKDKEHKGAKPAPKKFENYRKAK